MGAPETERNIAKKVSRGGFTAAFFVQCLEAIGATELRSSRLTPPSAMRDDFTKLLGRVECSRRKVRCVFGKMSTLTVLEPLLGKQAI
jgi:hypothetical protein